MRVELSNDQRRYLKSVAAMNIRKRRKDLTRARKLGGQSQEDFEDWFQRAQENLYFREATYAALCDPGENPVVDVTPLG